MCIRDRDGVHHAGHGGAGAGTDGDQQGVLVIAELLAGDLLHLLNIFHDLGHDLVVDLTAILIVLGAGLGGIDDCFLNCQLSIVNCQLTRFSSLHSVQ